MGLWDDFKKLGNRLNPLSWGDESESAQEQRRQLEGQAGAAGAFADQAQQGYGALGGEAAQQRDYLRRLALGQDSVSAEQLRQGLQQGLATQRSLAAGAAPANAAGAARTAAIQSARLTSGMAGQQAIAGLQERQAAQQALAKMLLEQRQQELQAALNSRQTAIGGYGTVKPEGSFLDKYGGAITGAAAIATKSDRRAKKDIRKADHAANRAIDGLRAYTFAYKDKKDGARPELGVMAQDLEKAGLRHAVIDTPQGKLVHGAKLATTNTAMLAALGRRVAKLEGRGA